PICESDRLQARLFLLLLEIFLLLRELFLLPRELLLLMLEQHLPGLGHFYKMPPVLRSRRNFCEPTACLSTFCVINSSTGADLSKSAQGSQLATAAYPHILFGRDAKLSTGDISAAEIAVVSLVFDKTDANLRDFKEIAQKG